MSGASIHIVYKPCSTEHDGRTYCGRTFRFNANVYQRTPDDGITCDECMATETASILQGNPWPWHTLVILPSP